MNDNALSAYVDTIEKIRMAAQNIVDWADNHGDAITLALYGILGSTIISYDIRAVIAAPLRDCDVLESGIPKHIPAPVLELVPFHSVSASKLIINIYIVVLRQLLPG